jgi:two-component system NarL family response regulator
MKAPKSGKPKKKSGGQTKRIRTLVVDDSPRARHAVCYFLETQKNIELVGTAPNGREALEQVDALRPDLVLMDIQMPEMNGLETTQQLRQRFPSTRVIMITLHDGPGVGSKCHDSGAHGFVAKSRLPQKLPAEISRVFRNP